VIRETQNQRDRRCAGRVAGPWGSRPCERSGEFARPDGTFRCDRCHRREPKLRLGRSLPSEGSAHIMPGPAAVVTVPDRGPARVVGLPPCVCGKTVALRQAAGLCCVRCGRARVEEVAHA
jgi:hypothetical protein